jgi:hypothetical protein
MVFELVGARSEHLHDDAKGELLLPRPQLIHPCVGRDLAPSFFPPSSSSEPGKVRWREWLCSGELCHDVSKRKKEGDISPPGMTEVLRRRRAGVPAARS